MISRSSSIYAIFVGDPGYCATICNYGCKLRDIINDKLSNKVDQNIGKVVDSDENFGCRCLEKKRVTSWCIKVSGDKINFFSDLLYMKTQHQRKLFQKGNFPCLYFFHAV